MKGGVKVWVRCFLLSVEGVLDVDILYRDRPARLLLGFKGVGPTESLAQVSSQHIETKISPGHFNIVPRNAAVSFGSYEDGYYLSRCPCKYFVGNMKEARGVFMNTIP